VGVEFPDLDSLEFALLYVTLAALKLETSAEERAELAVWNAGPVVRWPELAVVMFELVVICGNVLEGNVAALEVDVECYQNNQLLKIKNNFILIELLLE
jgi:hypothetical protein